MELFGTFDVAGDIVRIIWIYEDAASLLRAHGQNESPDLRSEHFVPPEAELMKSLEYSISTIRYHYGVGKVGHRYAIHDKIAQDELKEITIRLQSELLNELTTAREKGAVVNYQQLQSVSDECRDQCIASLNELEQRLAIVFDPDEQRKTPADYITGNYANFEAANRSQPSIVSISAKKQGFTRRTIGSKDFPQKKLDRVQAQDSFVRPLSQFSLYEDPQYGNASNVQSSDPRSRGKTFPSRRSLSFSSTDHSSKTKSTLFTKYTRSSLSPHILRPEDLFSDDTFEMNNTIPNYDLGQGLDPFTRGDDAEEKIRAAVNNHDRQMLEYLISDNVHVSTTKYEWFGEVLAMGCTVAELVDILLEEQTRTPWLMFGPRSHLPEKASLDIEHHCADCIHQYRASIWSTPEGQSRKSNVVVAKETSSSKMIEWSDIRHTVAEFCGIGGLMPPQPPFSKMRNLWFTAIKFEPAPAQLSLSYSCKNSLLGRVQWFGAVCGIGRDLLAVLAWMQSKLILCNSFTAMTYDTVFSVKLVRIEVRIVEEFVTYLENGEAARRDSAVEKILRLFGGTAITTSVIAADPVHFTSLACQLLCFSLLSYSFAHLAPFQPFFLDQPIPNVALQGGGFQTLSSRRQTARMDSARLTCLHHLVKANVLIIHWAGVRLNEHAHYNLRASPEDIIDTWGPARIVPSAADHHLGNVERIDFATGSITASDISDWLHFAGYFPQSTTGFALDSEYVIGALSVNDKCPLNEEQLLGERQRYLVRLGTSASTWELAQRQLALQVGQYAALQGLLAWNKKPGVTIKDRILESLTYNRVQKPDLEARWAVQVSLCTGLTRRVRLLELLADVTNVFVANVVPLPPVWKKLTTDLQLAERFQAADFWEWFNDLDPDLQIATVQVIAYVLSSLSTTGIDENKNDMVIAWTLKQDPSSCIRVPCTGTNFWTRILADSEECATFSYMTSKCFESSMHKCRKSKGIPWINDTASLDTAVSCYGTGVVATESSWALTHDSIYAIGKPGGDLVAKVSISAAAAEPRLSIYHTKVPAPFRNRLAARKPVQRIREPGAIDFESKKVLVLSR